MGEVHDLYFDTWINASNKLLEYFEEYLSIWEELSDYRKFGKLEYFSQLSRYLAILESGVKDGKLTEAQMRKHKALCRKAETVQPIIDCLKREYEEYEKERRRNRLGRKGERGRYRIGKGHQGGHV